VPASGHARESSKSNATVNPTASVVAAGVDRAARASCCEGARASIVSECEKTFVYGMFNLTVLTV